MRVVCLMSVFNEEDLIEESLRSVAPFVDYVYVCDGPYVEYPRPGWFLGHLEVSSDGTREVLNRLVGEFRNVGYYAMGRLPEQVKRSTMFKLMADGDVAFILDADEIV